MGEEKIVQKTREVFSLGLMVTGIILLIIGFVQPLYNNGLSGYIGYNILFEPIIVVGIILAFVGLVTLPIKH